MREGWEIRKLGDLTTALNGLWVGKKPPFVNIAVIRNTNFTKDCQLDTTDIAYIDAEVKHFSTRKLQCGDIIIEKSGGSDKQPVGRPILFNIPEGDFSFSNFTSTLRINDQSEMLPSFLHKVLWAIYRSGKTTSLQSKTTGIRNLDFKSYLKLPIPVPSIAEQEKIAAELDCLTGIIEKKKQQLKELDKLAQSIFYDMFGDPITNTKGWSEQSLGDLTTALNGLWVGKKPPFVNIAVIRNTNFTKDCQLDTKNIAFIDAEVKHFSTRKLQCGDIIIEKSGGSDKQPVGRPILFNIPEGDYSFSNFTSTLRIKSDKAILPIFLHKVLCVIYQSGKTASLQSKTTGIRNLDFKAYLKLTIPLPPLDLQNEFAQKVEAIEKQKELVKRSIAETEILFNSRMDYWFNA